MGSSKKSKDKDKDRSREHKKKRRRSHSRSRSPHERKHKRKDRDRSRDRDRDRDREREKRKRDEYEAYEEPTAYPSSSAPVEIPGLGDPYVYAEPAQTYGGYEEGEIPGLGPDMDVKEEKPSLDAIPEDGQGADSLSIEATNALRAKLGLKPLDTNSGGGTATTKKEDVHVPAVNLSQVKKQEDLKNKLMAAKEKRRINALLGKVKTLGEESDDDDDVSAWVSKMRKAETERKLAEKRAKLMDEMDNEFGISDLVEEEFGVKEKQQYSSKHLAGLKVQHAGSSFKEGKTVILTLEDKGVLDEGDETLINVNMLDDERYAKNIENKKKKPDYKPYEDDEYDEYGMPRKKEILDKYDEEIDGEKKEGFTLKAGGQYVGSRERLQEEMREEIQKHRIELNLPAPSLASEFYTEEEMLSFKKVKKKVRKIRKKPKMLKADDLLPLSDEPMDIPAEGGIPGLDYVGGKVKQEPHDEDPDVEGPEEDLTGVVVDDEAASELQMALEKTRKLKTNKQTTSADKRVADDINEQKKYELEDSESDTEKDFGKSNIILNQTSEFCRTLGDIPTYGQAGNRVEDEDDVMDIELERPTEDAEDMNNPGWQEVAIDEGERTVDLERDEKAVLDDEPVVGLGVGAALSLATKKGYLSESKSKQPTAKKASQIESQNYSIEDKRNDDLDDKYRKRDRFSGGGMVSDFKEKEGYKPNVKLDYVDDTGRVMSQKEAFRLLSHSFHGKGSGKMKTEKRKKKIEEEQLMKSMSSTDTPLGTAAMLEDKLQRQKTPYLVLSGGNKTLTTDRISK